MMVDIENKKRKSSPSKESSKSLKFARYKSQKFEEPKTRAPWANALQAVDTIKEEPEMIEVDDSFNADQMKAYRSLSNQGQELLGSTKN